MSNFARVRKVVQPVVGDRAWHAIHSGGHAMRAAVGDRVRLEREVRSELAQRRQPSPASAAPQNAPSLTHLAQQFHTDKWGTHRYTPHYDHFFARFRNRPVRVLEIGVGLNIGRRVAGASLRMWREYFPLGEIYGLDIKDWRELSEPRMHIYQGDQSDPEVLRRIVADAGGSFDIIIDDGSHVPAHILASFETLFPVLADDGIYAIEDLQTSYWPEWGGEEDPATTATSMGLLKKLADGLNYEEFVQDDYVPSYTDSHIIGLHFFHNLAFIEKGTNAEGTLKRSMLRDRYAAKKG